jgi:hypothetical protein
LPKLSAQFSKPTAKFPPATPANPPPAVKIIFAVFISAQTKGSGFSKKPLPSVLKCCSLLAYKLKLKLRKPVALTG